MKQTKFRKKLLLLCCFSIFLISSFLLCENISIKNDKRNDLVNYDADVDENQVLLNNSTENEPISLLNEEEELLKDIRIISRESQKITIEYNLADLRIENISCEDGNVYQRFFLDEGGHTSKIGKPELPVKSKYIIIPDGANFQVKIISSEFELRDGFNIYPFQPNSEQSDDDLLPFVKNETYYKLNTFFPSEFAYFREIGVIRGERTGLLTFSPILYNPAEQSIKQYSKIQIDIIFEGMSSSDSDGIDGIKATNKYTAKPYESLYESLYLNYEKDDLNQINTEAQPDSDSIGADYLIISPDGFTDNLAPLVSDKESQGLTVKVATLTETGSSLGDIKNYIQNAYDTWDIPPIYLLLVGDSNLIPTEYVQHYGGDTLPTDLYYATVDGDDFFPDLLYGRLPVRTDVEVDIVVSKILNWVNDYNPSDPWRQKVLLSAYDQSGRYFIETSESIRTFLQGEGYTCTTVYAGGSYTGTTQDIINAFNAGTFFVNHRDHGIADGWGYPSFRTSDVSSLTNNEMFPVVFSVDCETGHFDDDVNECLAEAILKANGKGAVSYIGATRGSWSGFNDELNRGLISSVWPDYFSDYTNNAGHSTELGAILNFGKIFMFDKYVLTDGVGSEGTVYPWESVLYPMKTRNTFEMFHVFGDPQLSLIPTDIPSEPYNPTPQDNEKSTNTNPQLSVKVWDPNGDQMNVSFYKAADDSLIGEDRNISSGREASIQWYGLSRDTEYSWYANVTDGIYTMQSPTWSFKTRKTTEFSRYPIIINELNTGSPDAVELYNFGPDQDMTGWYFQFYAGDNLDATYYFPIGWTFQSQSIVTIYEYTGTDSSSQLYTGDNINYGNFRLAGGLFNKETENVDWFQTSDFVVDPPRGVEWENDTNIYTSSAFAYRISDYDTDRSSDWTISSTGSIGSLNSGQTGVLGAPNIPNNPNPSDASNSHQYALTLSADVSDPNGKVMDVSFYNGSNDELLFTDLSVNSGATASHSLSGLAKGTTYSWYLIADNGYCNTISPVWTFTTNYPPAYGSQSPSDSSVGINTNPTLSVDVSDNEGGTLDVTFYNASDDSQIGSDTAVASGGTASMTWSGLADSTTYSWYIIIDDGIATTTSQDWTFTTNYPPTYDSPSPSDSSVGINTNPTLSVDVSDNEGGTLDVIFYNASDDSQIGSDTAVASGGTASITWNGLADSTTYSWYVIIDDGIATTTSQYWDFTTNYPPAYASPTPSDSSVGINTNPTLSIDVSDNEGDTLDVTFYNASDDSQIGSDTGVASGGTASITWNGLADSTTYSWYVIIDDGIATTTSQYWDFTTNYPPAYASPNPSSGSFTQELVPTLSVDVSDNEGNTLDVTFYNASDDSQIGSDTGVASGSTASAVWSGLDEGSTYSWYVIIDDGLNTSTSAIWTFTINVLASYSNPSPTDSETGLPTSTTLSVDVSDSGGGTLDATFYNASDDMEIGVDTGVASGSTASVIWSGLDEGSTYSWYVIIDDGINTTTSESWSFTTNYGPTYSNPNPPADYFWVEFSPTLSLKVSDEDGDTLDVTFYNASDDSQISSDIGVASGTTASVVWSGLDEGTTYSWYAIIDDGITITTTETWSFTTNYLPTYSNPIPANESVMVETSPLISLDVENLDGNIFGFIIETDVRFFNASNDEVFGMYTFEGLSAQATVNWNGLNGGTTYSWYAEINDGVSVVTTEVWTFTTNYPPIYANPTPSDGEKILTSSIELSIDVDDGEGLDLDVIFYNASDDTIIGTDFGVASGGTASVIWSNLVLGNVYSWYVIIDDGITTITSDQWSIFTNQPSYYANPRPDNGEANLNLNCNLSIDVFDDEGDNIDVYFYDASNDNLIGSDLNVASGGTASILWNGLTAGSNYLWYVRLDDGYNTNTSIEWTFTTSYQPTYSNPAPLNGELGVSLNPTISIDVHDMDGDSLDVIFYNASDDGIIGADLDISAGTTASIELSQLGENLLYSWYAVINDSKTLNITSIFTFQTIYTIPTWDEDIEDKSLEFGNRFRYDVNASDISNIDYYSINDTTYFTINSENGVITNTTQLLCGLYNLEITAHDTFGYICTASIIINVSDTTKPYWIQFPTDKTITHGESLFYELKAKDLSGIDRWWTNNSIQFHINSAGILRNITHLEVGTFWITIRAIDMNENYCECAIRIIIEETEKIKQTDENGKSAENPQLIFPFMIVFISAATLISIVMIVLSKKKLTNTSRI